MHAVADAARCPDCGCELPAEASAGQCPDCLLRLGLETERRAGVDATIDMQSASTAGFEPPKPEELAASFPQLEILDLVGHGGMGAVYKARQKSLDRIVALKIIRSSGLSS